MKDTYRNRESFEQKYAGASCKTCLDRGWVSVKTTMREYQIRNGLENIYGDRNDEIWTNAPCPDCRGGASGAIQNRKRNAEIPAAFYDSRMDAFSWEYIGNSGKAIDTSEAQKVVESFIAKFDTWEQNSTGLYIYSAVKGSGKTFLASCICNELIHQKQIGTRFVNANELLNISQSGDRSSMDKYKREPLQLLKDCKLLVIDDLGQKNGQTSWLEDILYPILDDRMNKGRITIVTSNYSIDNLPLDERITDRINSMCYPLRLPDVKMRAKEAQSKRSKLMEEVGID